MLMAPELSVNVDGENVESLDQGLAENGAEESPVDDFFNCHEDYMKQSWQDDQQGDEFDRNTSEFRQIRGIKNSFNAWIAENGGARNQGIWDTMENVTSDGKVRKRVIYQGSPEMPIVDGMFVAWQYTGFVEPNFDKVIDATRFSGQREIFRVEKVSDNDRIQRGLRLGVSTMHLGETAHFRIHPDYAFGRRGVPPRIPPDAFLHYVIEIRDEEVDDRKASNKFLRQQIDILEDLGLETCLKAAHEFRERGIVAFQKKSFDLAKENFDDGNRAITVCETLTVKSENLELIKELTDLGNTLQMNAAVTNAKLDNWKLVAELTRGLTMKDEKNTKALYYQALAYFHLKQYEEGLKLASTGIKLRPGNSEFGQLYAKLEKHTSIDREKEKMFCKRIFASVKPAVKQDRWALVGKDVKDHVLEGITKLKTNSSITDIPMDYVFFNDKVNLSYLEDQAKKAKLSVHVKTGKVRTIVRLIRK